MKATAIVLAGGKSERMGIDKATLKVGKVTMIEHICKQLQENFDQVLVSAADTKKYSFLGYHIVADVEKGQGPLMGIACALAESKNDLNFIIACDIPDIDFGFVEDMINMAQSGNYDAVVPKTARDDFETLFAVYRKSLVDVINESLASGKRRITDIFERCNVKHIILPDAPWLKNLNTPRDYHEYQNKSG